jgi:Bacterial pre-peptidase C-terminal domain
MRRLAVALLAAGILATAAGAFLVSNSPSGGTYVFESVPASRRPIDFTVDTEAVPNVANPLGVTQDLMDQWNGVAEAEAPFGTATAGGPYNGSTVGSTFGTFTNTRFEVAWDDSGEILSFFGLSPNVLGITLKSVDTGDGEILDLLVIVNTEPTALVAPGTGATAEDLFRSTLLHELGHATGLAHSPVGMVNPTSFGLALAAPSQIPTMFPFRLPLQPQLGGSIEPDDRAGLIDIYPLDTSGLGSISGTVRGLSGGGANQVAVRAIGPFGVGEDHVGVLTDEDRSGLGRFTIRHLAPGAYRVVVEAVNGRTSVTGATLSSNAGSLGTDPFVYFGDEFWQPGDTYDPGNDLRTDFALVHVRAGRDTGAVDVVLNALPLAAGAAVNGAFGNGDEQLPNATGGFVFADYYVFAGTSGDAVTVDAAGSGTVAQLRVLRPSDLEIAAEALPLTGSASVAFTLPQTGVYTVAVSARASTGNPGGTGSYTLTLGGASGTLPPAPPLVPATATLIPVGDISFSSPVCDTVLLRLLLTAPSHEELWVDAVTVTASGSANDALDVGAVSLVHDANGNGQRDGAEPVLGSGTFAADDGTLSLSGLDIELDPGEQAHLLVVYDVTVQSVSSAPQQASFPWWLAVLLVPLAWKGWGSGGPRRLALVVLPLVLATCGGGGGGSGCNGAFDPAGAVVTLGATVAPGGITAFTTTADPGTPLALPTAPLASGTFSVSN